MKNSELISILYGAAAMDALGKEWHDSEEIKQKSSDLEQILKEKCGGDYGFTVDNGILELSASYEKQGFCAGFKLGARLMMEVLCDE